MGKSYKGRDLFSRYKSYRSIIYRRCTRQTLGYETMRMQQDTEIITMLFTAIAAHGQKVEMMHTTVIRPITSLTKDTHSNFCFDIFNLPISYHVSPAFIKKFHRTLLQLVKQFLDAVYTRNIPCSPFRYSWYPPLQKTSVLRYNYVRTN